MTTECVHKWVSFKNRSTGVMYEKCSLCDETRPYTKQLRRPSLDRMIHGNQSLTK